VIFLSYENKYMENAKLKSCEQGKDRIVTMKSLNPELICNQEAQEMQKKDKLSNKSTEQDLDVFLLGEGNKDDEPGTPYYLKDVSLNAFIFKVYDYKMLKHYIIT